MENKKGIYIPIEIWTIKNLNINEKLILSDIYQKRKLESFTGYNKKTLTLFEELGIFENQVKKVFESLQAKGFIFTTPTYLRAKGEIKKVLANRDINTETLKNANRFIIPNDNIFYKNSQKGVFITFEDIIKINSYGYTKQEKRYNAKTRDRNLLIYLIITKISFYRDNYSNVGVTPLLARFKIKDLSEFMGLSYKTVFEYVKYLTEYKSYNQEFIKILYNLGKKEDLQDLYNKFNIKPSQAWFGINDDMGNSEEIKINTARTLYFINTQALEKINLFFDTLARKI